MEWNGNTYIGVSPDGIARIWTPENLMVLASVEIKTRGASTTINLATKARERHGTGVWCEFGDDVFKYCVPSANRSQILHQATVTGLDYVLYVVAKVEDDRGSIVQTIVVHINDNIKDNHAANIEGPGLELVGWITTAANIRRGYLLEEDFPSWVTEDQRKTITTRFPLWSAQ